MKIYSKYSKIVGVVSSVAIWRKEHTHLSCVSEYHTGINQGERNIHTAKRQHEKLNGQPIQQSKLTLVGQTRSAAISRESKWNSQWKLSIESKH
jgi:hypothetical protein